MPEEKVSSHTEALRDSGMSYQLLFESNPLPMWVYDVETLAFLAVNDATVHHYGYSRDEFLTMTIKDIRPLEDVPALLEKLSRIATGLDVEVGVWRHRKKNGTRIEVDISSYTLTFAGRRAQVILASDISERKRAEDQLKTSREQLRALSAHLQSVREEERTRIAREIHDELGQELTGLKIDLSWLAKRLSEQNCDSTLSALLDKIKAMSESIDTTIQSVRRISTELRPGVLDAGGLTAAIEWQAQEFQNRTGITCEYILRSGNIILNQDRSTAMFRIFQEILTNVARHAKATEVNVSMKESADNLILEVRDNGRGITESEVSGNKSLGLLGMRERALLLGGEINISGMGGSGTVVTVRIPLRTSECS